MIKKNVDEIVNSFYRRKGDRFFFCGGGAGVGRRMEADGMKKLNEKQHNENKKISLPSSLLAIFDWQTVSTLTCLNTKTFSIMPIKFPLT